jgi:hypothetical protein
MAEHDRELLSLICTVALNIHGLLIIKQSKHSYIKLPSFCVCFKRDDDEGYQCFNDITYLEGGGFRSLGPVGALIVWAFSQCIRSSGSHAGQNIIRIDNGNAGWGKCVKT